MRFTKDEIRKAMLLYAVTDSSWLKEGQTLAEVVEDVLANGATFLQIREKEMEHGAFLAEARQLQAAAAAHRVPFVVNDAIDIALELDADGVHVGQSDMEALDVRRKLGPDKIIGVSAQTVEQALLAEKHGADYLGVGAVFPTGSKDDADDVSYDTLQAICRAVSIPVVAIGGISLGNVSQLSGSGICGIAVISAIYGAADIRRASEDLKAATEEMLRS